MYIPKHYLGRAGQEAIAFMRRFNFGIITTANDEVPVATHLPFVISEREDQLIISGHFAKANPHWKHVLEKESLIVFSEPHAYVSPTLYDKQQNVPTWNYMAVHVYGRSTVISEYEQIIAHLEEMMQRMEPSYLTQWNSLSTTYKENMVNGIVAFDLVVSRLESKEKLSQNKKKRERERIIASLSNSDLQGDKLTAEYMQRNEDDAATD